MSGNIKSALEDLLQAAKTEPICGSQQLLEKRRQFLALLESNATEWREAFAAFQGAFDTPLARRRDDSEYAQDARMRLRAFNESMTAAHGHRTVAQSEMSMQEFQVAFESDTLAGAVEEVMRLAAYVGQDVIFLPGSQDDELFSLKEPAEVRAYLVKAAQAAYDESGHSTAGSIRKVVYRGVGVVFERIIGDELRRLSYDTTKPQPIHVAQFWKRLGRD